MKLSSTRDFYNSTRKMKWILIRVLSIILLSFAINSQSCSPSFDNVDIICSEILENGFGFVGTVLSCQVDSSFTSLYPESSVSSVVHSNGSAVTNLRQIEAIYVQHATVKFIPTGIKSKFPNLKAIYIGLSGVLSVNKNNLKQFGDSLEYLYLAENSITSIDDDLFENNPNLKGIYFDSNPIRHIDTGFFTNLKKLEKIEYLSFYRVGCMDQEFKKTSGHQMATFTWNYKGCFDESAKVKTQCKILEMQQNFLGCSRC